MVSYIHLCYRAVASEAPGVKVPTSDPNRLRQLLYRERAQLGDPALANLQFRLSPRNPTGELWITKTGKKDAA